jgi:Uma2 family endonuclease
MSDVAQAHRMMTVTEYLAYADARPRQRFELLAGVPVAMAPATLRHDVIASNIQASLQRQVSARGCRSHRNVGLASAETADFLPQPDVMVRCGPVDDRRRWVSDPVVVIEVLSNSTMADDRGYKLARYLRDFPSLRHVVLVYQDEIRVEYWSRDREGPWGPQDFPDRKEWQENVAVVLRSLTDTLHLPAVGAKVALSEIYADVALT